MIISNIEGEAFSYFALAYITSTCKLLTPQVMMIDEWVSKVGLDIVECAKNMMIAVTQMHQQVCKLTPPLQGHTLNAE